jgi:RNA polymerase sigma factor (sigma-70 family)
LDDLPNLQFADRTPSPVAKCEQTEREERLRAGLARLTTRDRTTIRLVDFNGLSMSEAARTLAVSKAALKSTHFRARQRLGHVLHKMQDAVSPVLAQRRQSRPLV